MYLGTDTHSWSDLTPVPKLPVSELIRKIPGAAYYGNPLLQNIARRVAVAAANEDGEMSIKASIRPSWWLAGLVMGGASACAPLVPTGPHPVQLESREAMKASR